MYNCILVPTDGSAGMGRVIDHAARLARTHDADLHFLYVVNTAGFASLPMETSWESVSTLLREEGEEALEDAIEQAATDRTVSSMVEGSPSREIVAYANREGCDLVVMGTHGRGGLNRILLGSVAERVVRTSNVPVMTVRVGESDIPPQDLEEHPVTADPSVSEALE